LCVAVECCHNGTKIYVTAGDLHARLPVRSRGGAIIRHPWGAQGRTFYDQPRALRTEWPKEPWVPLQTIKSGAWAEFEPKPVRIAVMRFLVYREFDDAGATDHWVTLKPNEYLQGALLQCSAEHAVYIVTVDPPADLRVVTPWPRMVSARRKEKE
jgi:hypothetical protein